MGRRIERVLIAAIVLGLFGTACGDDGGEPSPPDQESPDGETAQPEPETSVIDEDELAICLEDAGLEVVTTGDLPLLGGVQAIGLRLSQGANIGPGDLSGALFVHASEADALAAEDIGVAYAVITHVRNVLIVFDPRPTDDERETVLACASGGTLG